MKLTYTKSSPELENGIDRLNINFLIEAWFFNYLSSSFKNYFNILSSWKTGGKLFISLMPRRLNLMFQSTFAIGANKANLNVFWWFVQAYRQKINLTESVNESSVTKE